MNEDNQLSVLYDIFRVESEDQACRMQQLYIYICTRKQPWRSFKTMWKKTIVSNWSQINPTALLDQSWVRDFGPMDRPKQ